MGNSVDNHYATSWRTTSVRRAGIQSIARRAARNAWLRLRSWLDTRNDPTFLRCLACHYVFDDQRTEFLQLIRMLKNLGQFVDTETCLAMAEGTAKIDGRYFHLSFDDGFKNVITNALPILMEERVPMMLFVPTDWIGADWEKASYFSREVAEYRDVVEMASWNDLQQMVANGFEVGSHTKTHVRLSTLSGNNEHLIDELKGAKDEIEKRLGLRCTSIAYPYGKPGDYDSATLEQARKAGYRAGFGIHRGTVVGGTTPLMLIPRHHFEAEWPTCQVRYFANGNMEDYWNKKVAGIGM